MFEPLTETDWAEYYEAMESRPLHPSYEHIEPYLHPGLDALELGCGIGHGTIHLCERGLKVTAVDISEEALQRLQRRMPADFSPLLIESDFREVSFPSHSFDIVIAGFSLFFLSPEDFTVFWPNLVDWIKPEGLFMGQILGPNDDWAGRENYNSQSSEDVQRLFKDFEVLHCQEDERDGETAVGTPKHWHVFHVLARKKVQA